ncbi:MAG: N-acetylmuramoyl-L-alanine amidase [Turicibacter sp.]|nr:N-acetylmuramoyl-L-alanine amidase [Turicibacter sp.]
MIQKMKLGLKLVLILAFTLLGGMLWSNDQNLISASASTVRYRAHVQNIGWQGWVSNGQAMGTNGQALRMEAINIEIDSHLSGGIEYRSHVQDIGWQGWVSNGALSGTSGQLRRVEAIQVRLTGEIANHYNIYYRVHVQNFGWLGWARNGESAGSAGHAYRAEAMEVRLVPIGQPSPGTRDNRFREAPPAISYSTHIENVGWQDARRNGALSGTTGQGLRLEGIRINVEGGTLSGGIEYRTHIQDIGWQGWTRNGGLSGTSGQARRLEAIEIRLTGDIANHFNVYYRVHAQNFGWLGWARNGQPAGTAGFSFRLEAIEVRLVPHGTNGPTTNAVAFQQFQMPRIIIDPGHGGSDPGAVGAGNIFESHIVLSVSTRLNNITRSRSGLDTLMTRTTNVAPGITSQWGGLTANQSVWARADFSRNNQRSDQDIFLSIHANAATNLNARGAETFYFNNSLVAGNHNPHTNRSRDLARAVQSRKVNDVGMIDRRARHGNFGVLRQNSMPAILVELGFMSNSQDLAILNSPHYQQLFAEAIYQGILDYFEGQGLNVSAWR